MATRAKGAGRKPKPLAEKLLHGNPGKRKLNLNEPKFPGAPLPPPEVKENKRAMAEWNRILDLLKEMDILKGTDQAVLATYCMSYARWLDAESILNREGQVVIEQRFDKNGSVVGTKTKSHPAISIAQKQKLDMMKAAALFGFDPSSRTRVQVPTTHEKPNDADYLDDLGLYESGAEDYSRGIQ
jgi:P27 family predicted phage terminase small subunit